MTELPGDDLSLSPGEEVLYRPRPPRPPLPDSLPIRPADTAFILVAALFAAFAVVLFAVAWARHWDVHDEVGFGVLAVLWTLALPRRSS